VTGLRTFGFFAGRRWGAAWRNGSVGVLAGVEVVEGDEFPAIFVADGGIGEKTVYSKGFHTPVHGDFFMHLIGAVGLDEALLETPGIFIGATPKVLGVAIGVAGIYVQHFEVPAGQGDGDAADVGKEDVDADEILGRIGGGFAV